MAETMSGLLVGSMQQAADSFAPGELAYLALTSKIERPLQDRLAWVLHTRLPDLVVAREWKRTDIAVLETTAAAPKALLEAKAMYTFDVFSTERVNTAKYVGRVEQDLAKAHGLDTSGSAEVYALVLATHPMGVPRELDGVIKYWASIRSSLRSVTPDALRDAAARTLEPLLARLGPVQQGTLDGGSAFGVPVAVDWWLIGPTPAPLNPAQH